MRVFLFEPKASFFLRLPQLLTHMRWKKNPESWVFVVANFNKRAGDTEEGKRFLPNVPHGSRHQDQSLAECKLWHWEPFGESNSTDSTRTHGPDCVLKGSLKTRNSQTPSMEQRLHPSNSLQFWQFRALESTSFSWPFFSTDRVTAGCWHIAHTCCVPGKG